MGGLARTGGGVVIVVGAITAGCLPSPEHHCLLTAECGAGTCVDGYCAFPVDPGVCGSGLRYGDGAGPRAGTCTDEVQDAGVDAPPPPPRFGRGVDGPVTIAVGGPDTINTCAALNPAAAGAVTLAFDSARMTRALYPGLEDFAADRLVLVWQATGLPPDLATPGSQAPVTLDAIGRYQLVHATAVGNGTLTLAEPLAFPVTAGAQVCRVPELTTITIGVAPQTISLRGAAWNGASGGVIAFYASGEVVIGGASAAIAGSGRGLRAGAATNNTGTIPNCTGLTGPASAGGGARRGEGLVPARFATSGSNPETFGRGNVTAGGGGGGCTNAGGGGGGGAGGGGRGGYQASQQLTGNGLGGAPLVFDPRTHLAFGGGGGGGEGDEGEAGAGGPGGGVVLLRAAQLRCDTGTGGVRANGATGGSSLASTGEPGDDGAGGGGGGGTIYVEAGTLKGCVFSAQGGTGGASRPDPAVADLLRGPGGGGGGGRVLVRTDAMEGATYAIAGGGAGQVTGTMSAHGADAGRGGVRCGDAIIGAGEACDDGNLIRGDGCDQCVRE